MSKCIICFVLITISIYLTTCSKTSPKESNVMTTTEASMMASKSVVDNSKPMMESKSVINDNMSNDDDINVMAVMTMCNDSFRTEMSFLISLNESGSFPDETDRTPKCFIRCVLQNLEITSPDDGKIDPERAAAIYAGERNGEPMGDLLDITTYCAQRDEKCPCEMAYNFLKCVFSMEVERYSGKSKS